MRKWGRGRRTHRAGDDREEGEADEGGAGHIAEIVAVGGARLSLGSSACGFSRKEGGRA